MLTSMPRLAVILVIALALTACGDSAATSSGPAPTESGRGASTAGAPTPGDRPGGAGNDASPSPPPPLTLYVSNQSFEDPNVHITISIDDAVVVDQRFAVEGQHTWVDFEFDVPPGDHTLTATSDTGAELTKEFTTTAGEPRWAVVDYWWYPGEGPREFTYRISDEPLAFG